MGDEDEGFLSDRLRTDQPKSVRGRHRKPHHRRHSSPPSGMHSSPRQRYPQSPERQYSPHRGHPPAREIRDTRPREYPPSQGMQYSPRDRHHPPSPEVWFHSRQGYQPPSPLFQYSSLQGHHPLSPEAQHPTRRVSRRRTRDFPFIRAEDNSAFLYGALEPQPGRSTTVSGSASPRFDMRSHEPYRDLASAGTYDPPPANRRPIVVVMASIRRPPEHIERGANSGSTQPLMAEMDRRDEALQYRRPDSRVTYPASSRRPQVDVPERPVMPKGSWRTYL